MITANPKSPETYSALLMTVLFAGATAFFAGCAGKPSSTPAPPPQPPVSLVWPAPPDPARIAFVRAVHRPSDVGVKVGTLTRIGNWLTGGDKGNNALVKPFGIALDEQGNLCMTDTGANTVCYYDKAKGTWSRWSKAGRIQFVSPVAVAKQQGTFYVADSTRSSVIAFDEGGRFIFETTKHLERPSGVAVLGEQLYVADSKRHRIVVFDLRGEFRTEFGSRGTGPGQFNFPTHVTADREGNLYVTDSMNGRVQTLDALGNFKSQVGSVGDSPGHFGRPKGVSVDTAGRIYVIDGLMDNVQIFDRTGRLLLNVGASGTQPGEFWLPNGIAINHDNEIYVADSYNHRVQVFKYIGPL